METVVHACISTFLMITKLKCDTQRPLQWSSGEYGLISGLRTQGSLTAKTSENYFDSGTGLGLCNQLRVA